MRTLARENLYTQRSEAKIAEMAGKSEEIEKKLVEMLKQEETENDQELDAQREAAHRTLIHEREEKQALKGEQAIMRKKFASFSEMAKLRNTLEERDGDIRELQRQGAEREKAIALLEKDVQEREESISDKERRMGELKGKNKELEKFSSLCWTTSCERARKVHLAGEAALGRLALDRGHVRLVEDHERHALVALI